MLGVDDWSKTLQRGIVHYNYRLINEDIFGQSYEMFLASNRKDEGIFYTPASITAPMADSLVADLFGPLVAQICAAASAGKADFATAAALMPQLARLTIADMASGSGGYLIKVLRAVWEQYQKLDQATVWVKQWQNGGNLLDTPPNVQQAREFRARWNLDCKRKLMMNVVERHLRGSTAGLIVRSISTLMFCRAIIPLCGAELNFRILTGTNRAFPDFGIVFGNIAQIQICVGRRQRQLFTRWRKHDKIPAL